MKKKIKRLLAQYEAIILLFTLLLAWIIGGRSFNSSHPYLAGFFGDINSLPNKFAPITALFTGTASIGAIYTVIHQRRIFYREQRIKLFYTLLEQHHDLANNVTFRRINEIFPETGIKAIKAHVELIKDIALLFQDLESEIDSSSIDPILARDLSRSRDLLREESISMDDREALSVSAQTYFAHLDMKQRQYFSNFLALLLFLHENNHWFSNDHTKALQRSLIIEEQEYLALYFFIANRSHRSEINTFLISTELLPNPSL